MEKTTYHCDRCEEEVPFDDVRRGQFFSVWLGLNSGAVPGMGNRNRVEVCRPCAIILGVLEPSKHAHPPEPAPDPEPDIWDAIEQVVSMCRDRGLLPEAE